jgi:hypothetical protein
MERVERSLVLPPVLERHGGKGGEADEAARIAPDAAEASAGLGLVGGD